MKTAPGVDPTAYVEAHFVDAEDAPILPGEVALLRDGAFVGQSRIGFVAPGDGVDLGFGGDDKIKVRRAPVNRKENDPTWYNQTKIETREFVTSVENLHAFPIKVRGHRSNAGVGEHRDIVDLSPATTPPTEKQVGDKRGVMSWTLDLKPGEVERHPLRLSSEVARRSRPDDRRRAAAGRRALSGPRSARSGGSSSRLRRRRKRRRAAGAARQGRIGAP